MIAYFINRVWNGVLVLFGVLTVVFLIFNLKPGDPARMLADQRGSEEALQNIRKDLGLDLSLGKRYLLYLNDLSPVSFHAAETQSPFFYDTEKYKAVAIFPLGGKIIAVKTPYLRRSYRSRRDVSQILGEAFPSTALLAISAIVLALLLGISLGTLAAVRKGTFIDSLILGLSAVGMSGPSFFMAVIISWVAGFLWFEHIPVPWLLIILPAICLALAVYFKHIRKKDGPVAFLNDKLNATMAGFIGAFFLLIFGKVFGINALFASVSFPGTNLSTGGSLVDLDPFSGEFINLSHLILPAITLGVRPLSVVVQLTRSSLLDVLSQDHVRTARAKGLAMRTVVIKHGLRNALIPVVTTISGWLASLLAGAVFVEFVFGWKGMGLEVFTALENEDFPVVMGAVLVFSTIFVVMNILVDLIYGMLDPRVRTT